MKELNEKLNAWAGTEGIDYTDAKMGIAHCFEGLDFGLLWFIVEFRHIETSCDYYVTLTDFYLSEPPRVYKAINKKPARALCLAIEKLIDSKGANQ